MRLEVGRGDEREGEKEPWGRRDGWVRGTLGKKGIGECQKGNVTGLEERAEMECVPE